MRLIDADALKQELSEFYFAMGWGERDIHFSLADLKANIDMAPTITELPAQDETKFEHG